MLGVDFMKLVFLEMPCCILFKTAQINDFKWKSLQKHNKNPFDVQNIIVY